MNILEIHTSKEIPAEEFSNLIGLNLPEINSFDDFKGVYLLGASRAQGAFDNIKRTQNFLCLVKTDDIIEALKNANKPTKFFEEKKMTSRYFVFLKN